VHLVEAVHPGCGLLGDALDLGGNRVQRCGRRRASAAGPRDDAVLLGVRVGGRRTAPGELDSLPLCTSRVASPPSSRIMLGPPPSARSAPARCTTSIREGLTFPGVTPAHRRALRGAVGANRDRVRRRGPEVEKMLQMPNAPVHRARQRLDEHGGLDVMWSDPVIRAPRNGWSRELAPESTSVRASRARRAGSPYDRRPPRTDLQL